jgi:serine/threonine protein kinase
MPNLIGQTVSHYKILERLGAGGMGVVYKAEDTRLKRTVALKFLPPALTTDPEARERFVHEAQAASALDHPNICTVHDVGDTDDGHTFIVMACYRGETLKEKIERGPLSANDALDIVVQVALGLSKAHQHGIIHRDIKPANIMVTDQGEVKILDFGLAKLSGMTMMTRTGSAVGTAVYMSPEQACGEKVDQRTDLWSLGVVLYQAVTGVLPFRSEYEQALMYGIMHDEPKGVREIKKDLPENIDLIIRGLLAKEPADRYASADDLLLDLLAARESSSAKVSSSAVVQRKSAKRNRKLVASGIVAIILAVAAIVALFLFPKVRMVKTNPNYTTRTLHIQSYQTGGRYGPESCSPGISRDGNWISFSAPNDSNAWSVYFMHVSWPEPRKIPVVGYLESSMARISPDGGSIAFDGISRFGVGGPRWLKILSTSGGGIRNIEDSISMATDWSPSESRIGYIRYHTKPSYPPPEFWSANEHGMEKRLEFADTIAMSGACWSPDGASVAWGRVFTDRYSELMTRDLRTGKMRQLTFDKKWIDQPFWMSNGTILFASDRSGKKSLWAIPEQGGDPLMVTNATGQQVSVSASGDGRRLLVPETEALTEMWVSDLTGAHTRKIKLDQFVDLNGFALASDFSRIAFVKDEHPNGYAIYVADGDGKNRLRIAQTKVFPFIYYPHCWSPDGKWIAYGQIDSLYVAEVANPGVPRKVCPFAGFLRWTEAGHLLVRTRDLKTIQYSVDGVQQNQVAEDSISTLAILQGRYIVHRDFHKGREGYQITPINRDGKVAGTRKKFLNTWATVQSADFRVWLFEKTPGELWKITLPECKEEYLGPIGPMEGVLLAKLSFDGKQVAYLRNNTTLRLNLIENLFQD